MKVTKPITTKPALKAHGCTHMLEKKILIEGSKAQPTSSRWL